MRNKIKPTLNPTEYDESIVGKKMRLNSFAFWEGEDKEIYSIVEFTGNKAFYRTGLGYTFEVKFPDGSLGWFTEQCFYEIKEK